MELLGKAARVFLGIPRPDAMSGNLGTAMLCEAASARAGRLSSAAAKNTRDLYRPERAKATLSEKTHKVQLCQDKRCYEKHALTSALLNLSLLFLARKRQETRHLADNIN